MPVAEKQARLKAVYERIHQEQPARSAICLSGGGIRSAIFGLGILQGLAKTHLLGAFDYLSTVSGGGYVGGWLTAWIKNHPRGAEGVFDELQRRPDSTLNPEPQPIRHLRIFSNYLTPKTGLTSVDTWTLIASYVRNMFLNWLVLISWLAAAMMIPRLHLAAILLPPEGWYSSPDYLQILHRYNIGLTILLVLGFLLIAIAMAYSIIDVPSTGNARFSQGRFLMYRQLPLLFASLVLTEWWALFRNIHGSAPLEPRDLLWKFVAFAVSSYLAGGFLALAACVVHQTTGSSQSHCCVTLAALCNSAHDSVRRPLPVGDRDAPVLGAREQCYQLRLLRAGADSGDTLAGKFSLHRPRQLGLRR